MKKNETKKNESANRVFNAVANETKADVKGASCSSTNLDDEELLNDGVNEDDGKKVYPSVTEFIQLWDARNTYTKDADKDGKNLSKVYALGKSGIVSAMRESIKREYNKALESALYSAIDSVRCELESNLDAVSNAYNSEKLNLGISYACSRLTECVHAWEQDKANTTTATETEDTENKRTLVEILKIAKGGELRTTYVYKKTANSPLSALLSNFGYSLALRQARETSEEIARLEAEAEAKRKAEAKASLMDAMQSAMQSGDIDKAMSISKQIAELGF